MNKAAFDELLEAASEAGLSGECEMLIAHARRWMWLRQQRGWPDSENAVCDYAPEQFDDMADRAINAIA